MNKLKSLEIKRLLKELDYIESDFEYRSEVISEADSEFIRSVTDFLEKHPELKEIYDRKITEKIDEAIKNKLEDLDDNKGDDSKGDGIDNDEDNDESESNSIEDEKEEVEDVKTKSNISPKLKKLYREIVKLTHPDLVKKKSLNDLYIEATFYYDNNDKIGIYKICTQLEIEYDIEDDDEQFIEIKINDLKKKIGFLESTFTWKWYKTVDEAEKNQILINYIKLRLQ